MRLIIGYFICSTCLRSFSSIIHNHSHLLSYCLLVTLVTMLGVYQVVFLNLSMIKMIAGLFSEATFAVVEKILQSLISQREAFQNG